MSLPFASLPVVTCGSHTFDLSGAALAQVAAPGGQPAAPAGGGGTQQQQGGGAPPGGGSFMTLLLPIVLVGFFWLFLLRPQQKKAKELDAKLKKGDRVFTNSGLIGKIVNLGDKRAMLEIAPNVKIEVMRNSIGGLDDGGDADTKAKDDKLAEAKK